MKRLLLSFCLLATASVQALTVGDFSVQVYNGTGFTPYYLTLSNGQVIGKTAGIPAAITIGGGSGTGTVTSVALTLPSIFSVTGSPVTASGTLAASLATQTANTIFAGPSTGAAATPTFRALVAADIPDLSATYQPLIGTGTLALSKLATDPLARANHTGTQAWSTLTGTPTTLAGYGITDSITAAVAASTYQPLSSNLTTYAGITPSTNVQSFLGAVDYAAMRTQLGLVIGTNAQAYSANLDTLAAGFGALYVTPGLVRWNGTGYQLLNTALPATAGGTGFGTYTTTGDLLYADSGSTLARLTGNTSTTKKFLTETGTGVSGTAPVWDTIAITDLTGLGTGIATALAVNTGSAGAPVLFNGAGGTPSSITLTNGAGLPLSTGITGFGSGVSAALAVSIGFDGAPVLYGGAGGTPSSINLFNGTALPVSGITSSTSTALGLGSIELGHASDTTIARSSAGNITVEGQTIYRAGGSFTGLPVEIVVACSDETTALTTGTAKVTFRMPHAMTVTSVRLQVNTAPTGSVIIVDLKEAGTTIFSTKPQIAVSAFTSVGGAVPGTLSDTALADDAEITINLDQIGSTIAGKGLKVTLIGTR